MVGGRPGGPGPKQPYNQRGQGQQQGGGGGPRGRQQPGGRMAPGGGAGGMGGGMHPHMQGQMGGPQEGAYPQEGGQGGGGAGGQQGGAIDPTRLASASVEEQKTILGEQLYPLIVRREPELAGKITGMILELDNTVRQWWHLPSHFLPPAFRPPPPSPVLASAVVGHFPSSSFLPCCCSSLPPSLPPFLPPSLSLFFHRKSCTCWNRPSRWMRRSKRPLRCCKSSTPTPRTGRSKRWKEEEGEREGGREGIFTSQ